MHDHPANVAGWGTPQDRRKNVRRLTWSAWARACLANTVAGATIGIVLAGAARVYPGGIPFRRLMISFSILGAVTYVIVLPTMWFITRAIVRRYLTWYVDGRPASRLDLVRLTSLPRMVAIANAGAWTLITALHVILIDRIVGYRFEAWVFPKSVAIYAFGFVIGTALAYLLVERVFRPYVRLILPAKVDDWPPTMGLRARLVLLWFTVAGAPLLLIAFTWVGFNPQQLTRASPVLQATALLTAGVGLVVFLFAGRTITAPLERLQTAQRRVGDGDLTARVGVDEAGEIGELEAGFNAMVDGLRERERVRDVFGRHVGRDVAKLALERDFTPEGELCEATALFVDVIGSTSLAQRGRPDEVVAVLNRFFDAVVRVVAEHGGLLNKFQGDGALCIFGTPKRQPDHAERGLAAARALARELAALGDVEAAIGVSSGEVVAGNVGTADRYEFTVIGDPVNEAARLTDEAKFHPSRVLASDRTIRAADDAAQGWIRGEAIALRGRSQPTITYSPYD